jgi:hypothetical protein
VEVRLAPRRLEKRRVEKVSVCSSDPIAGVGMEWESGLITGLEGDAVDGSWKGGLTIVSNGVGIDELPPILE